MQRMTELSSEEEAIVQRMVERKFRYLVLVEDNAAAVRKLGHDVYKQASEEARIALAPTTGNEVMYPPRGTNMEEYYKMFEPTLTQNAKTPFEHMYIVLVAGGLLAVINGCEFVYLSENAQLETVKRLAKRVREHYNPPDRQRPQLDFATAYPRLPIIPPLGPDAKLQKLQPMQVEALLKDFSKLHLLLLFDTHYRECYKVMDVNYSTGQRSSIESYEIQMEGGRFTVTISFDYFKEKLYQSSIVL